MNKESIEALRNGLEDSYWYSEDDEKTFERLVEISSAYEKVSKAYQYYMPNDEQQHPIKLVHELNKILISNFSPEDFDMDEFTFMNYNDYLKGESAND